MCNCGGKSKIDGNQSTSRQAIRNRTLQKRRELINRQNGGSKKAPAVNNNKKVKVL